MTTITQSVIDVRVDNKELMGAHIAIAEAVQESSRVLIELAKSLQRVSLQPVYGVYVEAPKSDD